MAFSDLVMYSDDLSFWEQAPPMGPSEDRSTGEKNQAGHRRIAGSWRRVRRPRGRACLRKGCERGFRPLRPRTRYCSEECRENARRWREWKARHHYRQSEGGNKSGARKAGDTGCARNEPEQATKGRVDRARVIARANVLPLLRSAWLLRGIPAEPTLAPAAILFALLSARPGAGSGARTALAGTGTRAAMEISARHSSGHWRRQVGLRWS